MRVHVQEIDVLKYKSVVESVVVTSHVKVCVETSSLAMTLSCQLGSE